MLKGSCHCGAVAFEAPTPTEIARCNCTYCDRVGALWAYCAPEDFTLTNDPANLIEYAPNQGAHSSCGTCGMVTHGRSPDWSDPDSEPKPGAEKISYNVRMDVDFDRSAVKVVDLDGRNQW